MAFLETKPNLLTAPVKALAVWMALTLPVPRATHDSPRTAPAPNKVAARLREILDDPTSKLTPEQRPDIERIIESAKPAADSANTAQRARFNSALDSSLHNLLMSYAFDHDLSGWPVDQLRFSNSTGLLKIKDLQVMIHFDSEWRVATIDLLSKSGKKVRIDFVSRDARYSALTPQQATSERKALFNMLERMGGSLVELAHGRRLIPEAHLSGTLLLACEQNKELKNIILDMDGSVWMSEDRKSVWYRRLNRGGQEDTNAKRRFEYLHGLRHPQIVSPSSNNIEVYTTSGILTFNPSSSSLPSPDILYRLSPPQSQLGWPALLTVLVKIVKNESSRGAAEKPNVRNQLDALTHIAMHTNDEEFAALGFSQDAIRQILKAAAQADSPISPAVFRILKRDSENENFFKQLIGSDNSRLQLLGINALLSVTTNSQLPSELTGLLEHEKHELKTAAAWAIMEASVAVAESVPTRVIRAAVKHLTKQYRGPDSYSPTRQHDDTEYKTAALLRAVAKHFRPDEEVRRAFILSVWTNSPELIHGCGALHTGDTLQYFTTTLCNGTANIHQREQCAESLLSVLRESTNQEDLNKATFGLLTGIGYLRDQTGLAQGKVQGSQANLDLLNHIDQELVKLRSRYSNIQWPHVDAFTAGSQDPASSKAHDRVDTAWRAAVEMLQNSSNEKLRRFGGHVNNVAALGALCLARLDDQTASTLAKSGQTPFQPQERVVHIVACSADFNGAFRSNNFVIQEFLTNKYRVVYQEFRSTGDMLKALNGHPQNIKYAGRVLSGHGSQTSIQTGFDEKFAIPLDGSKSSHLFSNNIVPNGFVILISCSTGAGEGRHSNVVKHIKGERVDLRVFGPPFDSNIKDIEFDLFGDLTGVDYYQPNSYAK